MIKGTVSFPKGIRCYLSGTETIIEPCFTQEILKTVDKNQCHCNMLMKYSIWETELWLKAAGYDLIQETAKPMRTHTQKRRKKVKNQQAAWKGF